MYNTFYPGNQIFIDAIVNYASQPSFIEFGIFHRKPCNSRFFTKLKIFKQ